MRSFAVLAPAPTSEWEAVETPVELSRKRTGTLYKKHILSHGTLHHPETGAAINVDSKFAASLKRNFDNNVCDTVQVPLANSANAHDESPDRNVGEVIDIEDDPNSGKIYAYIDARKHAEDFGKTLLGASAFMNLNQKDSKTNERVGPTLLHVAVTNRPYVTGLDPYEEVVAASEHDSDSVLVMNSQDQDSSTEEAAVPRKLEEVIAELRDDHEIDVEDLKTKLTAATERAETAENATDSNDELAAKVAAALKGTEGETKLSGGSGEQPSEEEIVSAVSNLAQRNVALSSAQDAAAERIAALERRNTEQEIDGLIEEGRILPAKREVYLSMALEHREMFDQVVPDEPVVAMSGEQGTSPRSGETQQREWDVNEEITRLTASNGPASQYVRQ